ncbi:hypothetical protein ACQ859_11070 [Roseateles chitinivorans]|uniref:hypothetical protein n=1 Tax=Roseateles chitinivorans TaxID=2917965 RepID=UPI003D673B70
MGFFDELKKIGRGIKESTEEFGKEMGHRARETRDQIQSEPGKFLLASAKGVAAAVVAVGKYAVDQGIPAAAMHSIRHVEEQYRAGNLSDEQQAEFLERRRKAALNEVKLLTHRLQGDLPDGSSAKDIDSKIDVVEKSRDRLYWYRGLPNLDLENEELVEVDEALEESKELLWSWRERLRDQLDAEKAQ